MTLENVVVPGCREDVAHFVPWGACARCVHSMAIRLFLCSNIWVFFSHLRH